jgi:peroxiredoxin
MPALSDFASTLRNDPKRTFSFLLNIILGLICILLIMQNRELKSKTGMQAGEPIQPGTTAESFAYKDLEGKDLTFEYDNHGTKHLFFVFSTTCPHCFNSLAEVQQLADGIAENEHVVFMGISLDDHPQTLHYFMENKLRYPVISTDQDFVGKYRAFSVPILILVDGNGMIEQTWIGELSPERRLQITEILNEPEAATQ